MRSVTFMGHLVTSPPYQSDRAAFGAPYPAAAVAIATLYGAVLAVLKWIPVNDALTFIPVLWIVVRLLDHAAPSVRGLALHLVTQIFVLAWIFHLWTLGYEGRNAVFGGILPWSDSHDYYSSALGLIHGDPMIYAAKRPIFAAVLAALLRLFDGNLRLPLLLFAMVGAWTIALATLEIWKTHGWRAAFLVCALLLLSERQWAGFIQTEHVGLPLGLIGFVLMWRAVARRDENSLWLAAAGLFAITVALMARAGPFFILPALALWAARELPGGRWKLVGVAGLAVLAGVMVHETVQLTTAAGETFNDYPAIAYGLMHGKDFTFLAAAHPELAGMSDAARTALSWKLVMGEAIAHPLLLIGGLVRSFLDLFVTPNGLFGFVWRNPDDIVLENGAAVHAALSHYGLMGPLILWYRSEGLYSVLNAAAMGALAAAFVVATVWALVALYRRPADAFATMLRYAVAGVLLSAPFTPPWITSSHQVEVATLAFLAAVPATIFAGPLPAAFPVPSWRLALAPAGFAAALLLGVALLRWAPVQAPMCRASPVVQIYPSTMVRVTPERSLSLHDKARADLAQSMLYLARHNQDLTSSVGPYLEDGTVYVAAYDACDGRSKLLVDDRGLLDLNQGWQTPPLCALGSRDVMRVGVCPLQRRRKRRPAGASSPRT